MAPTRDVQCSTCTTVPGGPECGSSKPNSNPESALKPFPIALVVAKGGSDGI